MVELPGLFNLEDIGDDARKLAVVSADFLIPAMSLLHRSSKDSVEDAIVQILVNYKY